MAQSLMPRRAARSKASATDHPGAVLINGPTGTVQIGVQAPRSMGAQWLPPARPIVFAPDASSSGGQCWSQPSRSAG